MRVLRLFRRVLLGGIGLLLLLLLAVGLGLLWQPTIPLDGLLSKLQPRIEEVVGEPLVVRGVRLRFALHPVLRIEELVWSDPNLHLSNLVLRASVPALKAGVLEVSEASIEQIQWAPEGQPAAPAPWPSMATTPVAFDLDLRRATVNQIRIELPGGEPIEVTDVEMRAPRMGQVRLNGQVRRGGQRANVAIEGGTLTQLFGGREAWPISAVATSDLGRVSATGEVGRVWNDPNAATHLQVRISGLPAWPGSGSNWRLDAGAGAEIRLDWQGRTLADLLKTLRADVHVENAEFTIGDDPHSPVSVRLRRFHVNWRAGQGAEAKLEARIHDIPFTATLDGPAPSAWPPEAPWTVRAAARGPGTQVRVNVTGEDRRYDAEADVTVQRTGLWTSWIKSGLVPDLPLMLHGTLQGSPAAWTATLDRAQWGRSSAVLHASGGDGPLNIDLDVASLQLDELVSRRSPADPGTAKSHERVIDWNRPVLPSLVRIPDTDVAIRIANVAGLPGRVGDIACRLTAREGRLAESAFQIQLGGSQWDGVLAGDLRSEEPVVEISVNAANVSLHELLALLGDPVDMDVVGQRVQGRVRIQGSRLVDIWRETVVSLDADQVVCLIPRPDGALRIDLPRLRLVQDRQHLTAKAGLSIGELEVEFQLVRTPRQELADGRLQYPLEGTLDVSGLALRMDGVVTPPLADLQVDLDLATSLDDPERFSRALSLPAALQRPVRIRANLAGGKGAYRLSGLDAAVGETRLTGEVDLGFGTEGRTCRVDLTSPSLELTDFLVTPLPVRAPAPRHDDPQDPSVTGVFLLEADPVRVGGLSVGRLEMGGRWTDKEITLQQLDLVSDVHQIKTRLQVHTEGHESELAAALSVSNFPYGVLAPLFPQQAGTAGVLYVDGSLDAVWKRGESWWPSLQGEIGFALFPEGLRSNLLDLWAVGILRAMAGPFTGGNRSQVECIAGRFDIAQGVWRPQTFYLDTSRIRVRGIGTIDPVEDWIHFKLKPRPKRRAFVHLATPVVVRGKLSDPEVEVSRTGLIFTAARLYFWVLNVIDALLRREIPEHDSDAYMGMMQGIAP